MRIFTLLICFFLVNMGLNAQNQVASDQWIADFVATYQLDAAQTEEIKNIQQHQVNQLAEIEVIKESQPAVYYKKLEVVRVWTNELLMKALPDDQKRAFETAIQQQNMERNRVAKKMMSEGASELDIQRAMLAVE